MSYLYFLCGAKAAGQSADGGSPFGGHWRSWCQATEAEGLGTGLSPDSRETNCALDIKIDGDCFS